GRGAGRAADGRAHGSGQGTAETARDRGRPMSKPTREQLLEAYAALREAGVEVSKAMAADGLSVVTAASLARAAARSQLDRLKADPQWFQKLRQGDAEATAEYERLNRDLAS